MSTSIIRNGNHGGGEVIEMAPYQPMLGKGFNSHMATKIIRSRKDFESLFKGFTKMQAVSYVASVKTVTDMFERFQYEHIELIVGENLAKSYKQQLGVGEIEELSSLIEPGRLKILVPQLTNHTKLYILSNHSNNYRVIQTSMNFTETGAEASRQINYALYADMNEDEDLLVQFQKDYQSFYEMSEVFMGDLIDLFKNEPSESRKEIIEKWLEDAASNQPDAEIKKVNMDIHRQMINQPSSDVVEIKLPEDKRAKSHIQKQYSPLNPVTKGTNLSIDKSNLVSHLIKTTGVPVMGIDEHKNLVLNTKDSGLTQVNQKLPSDIGEIYRCLEHIEQYINTVDTGQSSKKHETKMAMFETLIYFFSAPFANKYMDAKLRHFGIHDKRGPRYLYIYGPSSNGKTTYVEFLLKLITGISQLPLSSKEFGKNKIETVANRQTVYPLVFDDVSITNGNNGHEFILKSHWERNWQPGDNFPQIIITSNKEDSNLREWAKSRMKMVTFDNKFNPSPVEKQNLKGLLSRENNIYHWFSQTYLELLEKDSLPENDELYLGRKTLMKLYEISNRTIPAFFPEKMLEEIVDPGRDRWKELIHGSKKAKLSKDKKLQRIEFDPSMEPSEIKKYLSDLRQDIKCKKTGNQVTIENPEVFENWIYGDSSKDKNIFFKLIGRF